MRLDDLNARAIAVAAVVPALVACSGGGSVPGAGSVALTLGASVAYLGTTNACVLPGAINCLRGPAAGTTIALSQGGNTSNFAVTSADPSIATGRVIMQGPAGQGDPAVSLSGERAGSTVLTITGGNGATAQLPVTVTTVSKLTVNVVGIPAANGLTFTVRAPAGAPCSGFQGGYTFDAGL